MKRIIKTIEDQSSLNNMDMLVMRPLFNKECSASLDDLMNCDLDTILKINEFIDIKDSVEYQNHKDSENQNKTSMR
jgi:hypothetical protein